MGLAMIGKATRLSLCALAALAMLPGSALAGKGNSGNSGNSGSNGGVTLLDGPCVLAVGTSCLFEGNINLDNKLSLADDAYNNQTPKPSTPLDLVDLVGGEKDSGFSNSHSGAITSSFLVSYYAVKAGDDFRLYEIAPTYTFNWSTTGILNNGGQEP